MADHRAAKTRGAAARRLVAAAFRPHPPDLRWIRRRRNRDENRDSVASRARRAGAQQDHRPIGFISRHHAGNDCGRRTHGPQKRPRARARDLPDRADAVSAALSARAEPSRRGSLLRRCTGARHRRRGAGHHRRIPRRTNQRLQRRRHRAARRLLAGGARAMRFPRHSADPRRGDDGIRPHRQDRSASSTGASSPTSSYPAKASPAATRRSPASSRRRPSPIRSPRPA